MAHLVVDVVILFLISLLCRDSMEPVASLLAAPLVAVFMFRSFSMMHEAVHGSLLPNKRINYLLGLLYGSFCFLPFEQWKAVHIDHHYWSGNFERDSVMAIVRNYPKLKAPVRKVLNFLWKTWVPILALLQHSVFWWFSLTKLRLKPGTITAWLSILSPLGTVVSILMHSSSNFLTLTLPLGLVLFLMIVEVVNLPHHLELPQQSGDVRLMAWDQHKASRSCVYPKWFASHVVLNFNYHVEHHLFPDQAWYQLPQIHSLVRNELGSDYNHDLKWSWVINNRKNSLEKILLNSRKTQQEWKDTPENFSAAV